MPSSASLPPVNRSRPPRQGHNFAVLHPGQDSTAVALLAATLSFAVVLDHLWYGLFPAWLYASILAGILIWTNQRRKRSLQKFCHFSKRVITPWLVFVVAVVLSDLLNGRLEENFSKRVLLNLTALGMMIVVGTCTTRVKRSTLFYILVSLACAQGTVAICQFLRVPGAWEFPETIVGYLGASVEKAVGTTFSYDQAGRVRGLNLFIHMFNSTQGTLAAFLIAVLILTGSSDKILRVNKAIVIPLTLISVLGVVLTFSRSTILGGGLACIGILLHERKSSVFVMLMLLGSLGYFAAGYLDIQGASQSGRLNDMSLSRVTNQARITQYKYALTKFSESPLLGTEKHLGGNSILVHSVPLRLLTDNGLFGFFPYLAVIWGIFSTLNKRSKNSDPLSRAFAIAGMGGMFVALLDASTHSSGLLVRSVSQPAFVGVFLGLVSPTFAAKRRSGPMHNTVKRNTRGVGERKA